MRRNNGVNGNVPCADMAKTMSQTEMCRVQTGPKQCLKRKCAVSRYGQNNVSNGNVPCPDIKLRHHKAIKTGLLLEVVEEEGNFIHSSPALGRPAL
ncbi:hypothetical protein PoB_004860900 [Plakobranchus ocellatus]|uniref:Uncharacterized protein n=1 Tax=Plakobranchus ocellatus TaxID=259542 RepID=A0AAV4BTI3_9GAST|nr:hypothetical protein PoB_004860900 [Plakobranchus ocellatus]